jgi:hypothetical protein
MVQCLVGMFKCFDCIFTFSMQVSDVVWSVICAIFWKHWCIWFHWSVIGGRIDLSLDKAAQALPCMPRALAQHFLNNLTSLNFGGQMFRCWASLQLVVHQFNTFYVYSMELIYDEPFKWIYEILSFTSANFNFFSFWVLRGQQLVWGNSSSC